MLTNDDNEALCERLQYCSGAIVGLWMSCELCHRVPATDTELGKVVTRLAWTGALEECPF